MARVTARLVAAVLTLGRSDPRAVRKVDVLDHDPFLFDTQDKTIELKTGLAREKRPIDYIMRQDFFEFTPQFKLMIAGNHMPGMLNINEEIRRRMHLIPFTVTIPEAHRDKHLAEKLKAEWPGILKWMIEGCLRWQKEGLPKRKRWLVPRTSIWSRKT